LFTSTDTPDIETSTEEYAGRFTGPVGTWLLDEQWSAVWRMLQGCPGRRVLEVGGGHAQITRSLLDRDYDVTVLGSDLSCANRLKPLLSHERCRFQVCSILDMPYADDSFDVVIALRMMAHMDNWQRMLQESARVARHTVIIDYPSINSINRLERLLFVVKKALEGNTRPYRCFTTKIINEATRPFGLAVAGRRRQLFMPMVLHRFMKIPKASILIENACRGIGLTHMMGSPVVLKLSKTDPNDASQCDRPEQAEAPSCHPAGAE